MAERKFVGKVGRTLLDTEIKFDENRRIGKDAPNVLYIVLDDLGFAQLGCYGSTINTPNLDRLAGEGLRYNNFHTTAICSATRASLLTGANHHAVGVSTIIELATGCPNNLGHINSSYATTAEILKEYDYDTFAVGKWHLAESGQTSQAGPFENRPLGKGFDRYYGFLQGQGDQYHPILVEDNKLVGQPKTPAEGYHLSEDLTDHALDYLFTQRTAHPDTPFFLYLAYGAVHAPHHAPKSYIDKYKGKFDEGWDVIRERWYKRQKELGIIPADAVLTGRNEQVKPWDSLSADQKKLFARYMEAFAGFLEHTDAQIGRVLEYLRSIDQLDNTFVVFLSDNGASSEGGQEGRFNTLKGFDASSVGNEVEWGLQNFDKIGGEWAFNHYPLGWAHAGNTPFQWYKVWSHEGGVRDPLIIRYPKLIGKGGGIRQQYHHVSDITPTVLDVIGVEKPETIKGVKQEAMHGKSLKYSFQSPDAPSPRQTQYYEQLGNRAIYSDGWKAVVNHSFTDDFADDVWELYHVAEDFSESRDVATQYPDKLKELQDLWENEAQKYGVFPLFPMSFQTAVQFGGMGSLFNMQHPEIVSDYSNIIKPFGIPVPIAASPKYSVLAAVVSRRSAKEEGVIFASGDRFGGYSLYIIGNRIRYVFNYQAERYFTIAPTEELSAGDLEIRLEVNKDDDTGQGEALLYVNGRNVGKTVIEKFNFLQGFFAAIKANLYTSVSPDYEVPFEFQGEIKRLKIHTKAFVPLSEEEIGRFLAQD